MLRAGLILTAGLAGAAPASATLAIPRLPAPSRFVSRIDNPWFPLIPGTVYRYRGVKDGKRAIDVMRVTAQTRMIDGIRATVIADRLYLNGRLAERTTDWYAQERGGTVWYLGERTAQLDSHGHVTGTSGTWMTGVSGARAGIYMAAHPRPGVTGRQEYLKGQAEDQFKVLALGAAVHSPAVTSHQGLLTQETTRLEPGVVDHKLYVRGIGTVREQSVKGGTERLVLVSVHHHALR